MPPEMKRVIILCKVCSNSYEIELDIAEFNRHKEKGIVTVAVVPPCKHPSQVFIDNRFKYRGCQPTDIILDSSSITTVKDEIDDQERIRDEAADLSLKLASEIVVLDARDLYSIKAISADVKIDAAELALIEGDLETAREIYLDLQSFSNGIGDDAFANSLLERVKKIDAFLEDTSMKVLDKSYPARILLERLDGIVADIKFESMQGEISPKIFDIKKQRLMVLRKMLESDEFRNSDFE